MNPWNKEKANRLIQLTVLQSLSPNNTVLDQNPSKTFYLAVDNNFMDDERLYELMYYSIQSSAGQRTAPQINRISFVNPPAPMLTQFNDIPKDLLCNKESFERNCSEEHWQCVHLIKLLIYDTVELCVIGEGRGYQFSHPMHLHGHSFWVVGIDKINDTMIREEVIDLDSRGLLHRNLYNAPAKDSINLPKGGYVILRFFANNPGFWFFHCHLLLHNNLGMGLVFQVGEINQMPKSPKHFPRCGPWHFTGYEEIIDKDARDGGNKKALLFKIWVLTSMISIMMNSFRND